MFKILSLSEINRILYINLTAIFILKKLRNFNLQLLKIKKEILEIFKGLFYEKYLNRKYIRVAFKFLHNVEAINIFLTYLFKYLRYGDYFNMKYIFQILRETTNCI